MSEKGFIGIALILLISLVVVGGGIYSFLKQGKGLEVKITSVSPTPAEKRACTLEAKICPDGTSVGRVPPSCEFAPCPTSVPSARPGWNVYTNEKYGFEISYPEGYKALDDKENLYGWKNGVVLLYKGGQSYDLAIQVWESKDSYEKEYKSAPNLTVKEVGGKFITLLNTNFNEEVDDIIETFRPI